MRTAVEPGAHGRTGEPNPRAGVYSLVVERDIRRVDSIDVIPAEVRA